MPRNRQGMEHWLEAYGRARCSNDAASLKALFAPDATIQTAIAGEPLQLLEAFRFESLTVADNIGLAHWSGSALREGGADWEPLRGGLLVTLDETGRCRTLTEWWEPSSDRQRPGPLSPAA